jgi:hypothetical protein
MYSHPNETLRILEKAVEGMNQALNHLQKIVDAGYHITVLNDEEERTLRQLERLSVEMLELTD